MAMPMGSAEAAAYMWRNYRMALEMEKEVGLKRTK